MAINLVNRGRFYNVPVPVGTVSGDPVTFGFLPAVAATDRGTGAGPATHADVEFGYEVVVYTHLVEAVDAGGPSAVAAGENLYYDGTTTLNKNNGGILFGVAWVGQAIAAGTATIEVASRA